jgi:hypothetical protein
VPVTPGAFVPSRKGFDNAPRSKINPQILGSSLAGSEVWRGSSASEPILARWRRCLTLLFFDSIRFFKACRPSQSRRLNLWQTATTRARCTLADASVCFCLSFALIDANPLPLRIRQAMPGVVGYVGRVCAPGNAEDPYAGDDGTEYAGHMVHGPTRSNLTQCNFDRFEKVDQTQAPHMFEPFLGKCGQLATACNLS